MATDHRCPNCARFVPRRRRFCTTCWPPLEREEPGSPAWEDPSLWIVGAFASLACLLGFAAGSPFAVGIGVVLFGVTVLGNGRPRNGNGGPVRACTNGSR